VVVHEAALLRYLARVWPNWGEIHDLRQDAYVRVFAAAARHRPFAPKSFLFATARHLMADRVRRERLVSIETREDWQSLHVLIDEISPERCADADQELGRVVRVLELLPSKCRDVLWMRKLEQLSQKEVSCRLGINEKAVEKQLSRALRLLAAALRAGG
jgi:RNA polymerase sigma-70 factor (ECF subfamily)